MDNTIFWGSIRSIISDGFTEEGINQLENYGELFSQQRLIFKRFSPQEQYGCTAGGSTHVIATILAGAEVASDSVPERDSDFKREIQCGKIQENNIERWAKVTGIWIADVDKFLKENFGDILSEGGEAKVYDNGTTLIKSIGLDYFIQPIHALDRISLHNTYFPETKLTVIGFGRDSEGYFKFIVEQPYIEGVRMEEWEIENFIIRLGFRLANPKNWTYVTPQIYLSDIHDENIIKSINGNVYVIDCDIRLNVPEFKLGGIRRFSNEIEMME